MTEKDPNMPKSRFQRGAGQEMPALRVIRRTLTPLLVVVAILFLISGVRAIIQVYDLDVWVSNTEPSLQGSFEAGTSVITSGRASATVKLELVQEGRSEILMVDSVRGRNFPVFNPLPRRSARRVVVSPVVMSRFSAGPATIRATALGRSQWTRTPPPTVSSVGITIAP
jgi:hypothetical protein